tara:strand:- start:200 stop:1924 length:1725 start_codon:yes stop_codon:yes gene_type:complete
MAYIEGFTGSQNPVLVLGNLDFEEIKSSLVNYLKQSGQFKDYDFEGSALATLIDLLTYNSTLYSFYANMVANESFLDTAVKRESVYSLIKPLSYLPSSRRSPKADVLVTGSGETIKFGDMFTGNGYQWTPDKDYYINGNTEITLLQGNKMERVSGSLYDSSTTHQKFSIPDLEIDTSTLSVYVDEGQGYQKWNNAGKVVGNISGFTAGSKVYYLTGSYDGGYEIYFGDGVLGKRPEHQSQVLFEYLVTSGPDGNGTGTFISTVPGISVVETRRGAVGGSNQESLQNIKDAAPRMFQSQGRAVTSGDYQVMLSNNFGTGIEFAVWGGEENDPPNYGRVYVSAITPNREDLTDGLKEEIISYCKDKSVVSVLPEFIEPLFTDIQARGTITWDSSKTYRTEEEILQLISNYNSDYDLEAFNSSFTFSNYISGLQELDPSIVGQNVSLYLSKTFSASETSEVNSLTINFLNTLRDPLGTPSSTIETLEPFVVQRTDQQVVVFLQDDGFGKIEMRDSSNYGLIDVVGSVNYSTGRIQLNNLRAISDFTLLVDPEYNTISSNKNLILSMKEHDIEIISIN